PLSRALDDDERAVRSEARSALNKLSTAGALPYLVRARVHRTREARLEIVKMVRSIPGSASSLVELMDDDDEAVRGEGEQMLDLMVRGDALESVRHGLGHSSYVVRQRSALLLGKWHDAESIPDLADRFADDMETPEVRDAAKASLIAMRAELDPERIAAD